MRLKVATALLMFVLSGSALSQVNRPTATQLQSIEPGLWSRTSDKKDKDGMFLPPWKEITVAYFGFKKKPAVGSEVTIIPLDVNLGSFDLSITKVTLQENPCDENLPPSWQVDLEPIKDRKVFEIASTERNALIDVVVIYPAVSFAQQIAKQQLRRDMLPRGVAINTAAAAIDLTNDGKPDALILDYCCDNPRKSKGCDYTCGKTFKKIGNIWKLVDTSGPC